MEHDADNCPGCRPVILDLATKRPLRADDPLQRRADQAWRDALPHERIAWHRVTCLNSRNPVDMALVEALLARLGAQ